MPEASEVRADAFRVLTANPRGFAQAFVHEGVGGTPLLLVHGWPETKRIWWRNVETLSNAGFEVIVPDLRGFGESDIGPDGFHDVPSHSRDLYALVQDDLGHERIVAVGGDMGGPIIQDLALRFPGFVERLVIFNAPVPYLREQMAGLNTRGPRESGDYFRRQGTDADALAAELESAAERQRYIATFYTSRFWAHAGGFDDAAVDFMCEPFADGARLRASFGAYESAVSEAGRSEPAERGVIDIETLILFGPSDHVIYPDFDKMAAIVFPKPRRPVSGAGRWPLSPMGGCRRVQQRRALILSRPSAELNKELSMSEAKPSLSEQDVDRIADEVRNWGRWGPDAERGALNLITEEKRLAAGSLIGEGVTVSCAQALPVTPAPDNPTPVQHHMRAAETPKIRPVASEARETFSPLRRMDSQRRTSMPSATSSWKARDVQRFRYE